MLDRAGYQKIVCDGFPFPFVVVERRLYKIVEWVTLQRMMRLWVGVGVLQDPRQPHEPPERWLKLMKWVKRRGRWRLVCQVDIGGWPREAWEMIQRLRRKWQVFA